jgi:hypothetical protein
VAVDNAGWEEASEVDADKDPVGALEPHTLAEVDNIAAEVVGRVAGRARNPKA